MKLPLQFKKSYNKSLRFVQINGARLLMDYQCCGILCLSLAADCLGVNLSHLCSSQDYRISSSFSRHLFI